MKELPYPPPYQDLQMVAAHLGKSERTILSWVAMGQFPAPKKTVGATKFWAWSDIRDFFEGRAVDLETPGRIKNATEQEILRRDQERGVRKRNPGVPRVSDIQGSGA